MSLYDEPLFFFSCNCNAYCANSPLRQLSSLRVSQVCFPSSWRVRDFQQEADKRRSQTSSETEPLPPRRHLTELRGNRAPRCSPTKVHLSRGEPIFVRSWPAEAASPSFAVAKRLGSSRLAEAASPTQAPHAPPLPCIGHLNGCGITRIKTAYISYYSCSP